MATLISVQADSKDEAAAWLDKLRDLGLIPLAGGRVMEVPGRGGRWMARAVPADAPIPAPVRPVSLRKLMRPREQQGQQRQPGRTCTLPNEAS